MCCFETPERSAMEPEKLQSEPEISQPEHSIKHLWRLWLPACLSISALLVLFAVLLTYSLATDAQRKRDLRTIEEQKRQEQENEEQKPQENLALLESILKARSLYGPALDTEAFVQAVFEQYREVSGDPYAEYYSEETYQLLLAQMAGQVVGIGVTFEKETVSFEGTEISALRILSVLEGSPAEQEELAPGEYVIAVQNAEGEFETVDSLGFDKAIRSIQGEEGTTVAIKILYENNGVQSTRVVTCERREIEGVSVIGRISEADASVAVIRIKGFAYNTPLQFCRAMDACIEQGATKFVLDLRKNAGGSLIAAKAMLSYFFSAGETLYLEKHADGNLFEVLCEPKAYTGLSEGCTVTEEQIGQYQNYSFAILCDESTQSAAELFVAVLAEAGVAETVAGQKTFGKLIAQTFTEIQFQGFKGYLRFTVYESMTKNGNSYQGIGFSPDLAVLADPEYANVEPLDLTWEQDLQLQAATQAFQ